MIGKINKDGCLEIERAGTMKLQYCPFDTAGNSDAHCGDWCPHFGEAVVSEPGWELPACRHWLYFTEFTDERITRTVSK